MAGDLFIKESLSIIPEESDREVFLSDQAEEGRVLHVYGDRVRILELGIGAEDAETMREAKAVSLENLSEVEALGAAAFELRRSAEYLEAKRNRPGQGEDWNLPEGGCAGMASAEMASQEEAPAAAPTSAYMEGSIAVGIVIVEGPTAALKFSQAERTKIVAEVQNGLTFYASTNPAAGLTFIYDIRFVKLNVAADPNAPDLEARWRNPAMAALGFSGSSTGVGQYVESLRQQFKTRWTYCAFFTKYPVIHFAYASIGGPRLVMHYDNDGWGPDNIDRVFAHESGHVFTCPDEYAASNCNCSGFWGRWRKPNTNCQNCAPGGGISCIMKSNDWAMCTVTPAHLGWAAPRVFSKHSHKALDVAGGANANGTAIIQWDYHGGENQQFRPDHVGGGYYRFVAQNSGKVLDVAGASKSNGAQIIQWDWHGGNNQLFQIQSLGDGYVRITAKHSSKVIDLAGGSMANAAKIIQWDWHGGKNQRWLLTLPIVSKHSGKVLDVAGAATNNGASIIQWDHHGRGNQIFRPEPLGDGYHRFVAQHSGKVLDVAGASTANAAKIIQWDWHGGNNQRFKIQPLGDGHVRIIAKHSGKVIDLAGGSTANAAEIIQWDWHGGNNQRWLLPLW